MQVYVDDPAMAVRGSRAFRRQQVAVLMLAWATLGISLALKKGQLGTSVDWIGITMAVRQWGVEASITAARLQEVRALVDDIRGKNVISLKELRSFTGKVQSLASLLFTWRPCLLYTSPSPRDGLLSRMPSSA